jgi:hypothetical protein
MKARRTFSIVFLAMLCERADFDKTAISASSFSQMAGCGILRSMSKLLERAIEKVRELPEEEQDMAAAELIGYLAEFPTVEERAAIAEGRRAYERREIISLDEWRHDMMLMKSSVMTSPSGAWRAWS